MFVRAEHDEEERILQQLLQQIMQCAYAAFPFHDPNAFPTPPTAALPQDDVSAFFPAYERVRLPRNYAADQADQRDQAADLGFCRKFPSVTASLSPGNSS